MKYTLYLDVVSIAHVSDWLNQQLLIDLVFRLLYTDYKSSS